MKLKHLHFHSNFLSLPREIAITYSGTLSILFKNTDCQPAPLFGVDFPPSFFPKGVTRCVLSLPEQALVCLSAGAGEQPDSSFPTGTMWLSPPAWTRTHTLSVGLGIHLPSSAPRLRFQAAATSWFTGNNISINYDNAGVEYYATINKNKPAPSEQMQRALCESGESKELQGPGWLNTSDGPQGANRT